MKILVAEDEPMMCKTIALRLKKDGHDVIVAEDGREALEKLDAFQPDMIITDIMMPYASGLEIIAHVKKGERAHIPIIVLSAMGQEKVVLEAFELGANDYMTKPFSPGELSVRVKKLSA